MKSLATTGLCMIVALWAACAQGADGQPLRGTDWQLPEDAYDAVMDAEIVAPRPVPELLAAPGQNSPYLWGHPEFDYVRPLHARGGAWPYHWEVVSGPDGTSIGEFPQVDAEGIVQPDRQNYSMLHVPRQPEGSVSEVVVRMRDQDWQRGDEPSEEILIELQITWQADRWLVVSPDGDPEGAGTAADPLEGATFWNTVNTDDLYADKLILLRGGDYGVIDKTVGLDDTHPVVYLAAPGETPILRELFVQISAPDASLMGLTFDQPFERYNQYFIRIWGLNSRITISSNRFVGLTPGSEPGTGDGQDNPSGIMSTNPGQALRRDYLTIARNDFEGFESAGRPNFAAFITYGNARSVFEMNRLSDSNVMEGFFVKGAHYLTTVRANRVEPDVVVSDSRGGLTAVHFPRVEWNEFDVSGYVEHCWNHTPTGNLALIDRSGSMNEIAPNPNFMYRNIGNGVLAHSKQRQYVRWHIFNNVTMGAYGVHVDTPSGRWPSAIGVWPVQNGNAHILNDLYVDGRLQGDAARFEGFKGSLVREMDEPWPESDVFDGIRNVAGFSALDEKILPVTIGAAGNNRMLMVVSYQSGGNGRGQGYHLKGAYGQTAVHNKTSYDNIIISFFDDRLLPRQAGGYSLVSEEGGTESVYAIYAEGVAQQAPRTSFVNGDGIEGHRQFQPGDPEELVVFGALSYSPLTPEPLPGQTQILQGDDDARHHGFWRTGSVEPVGLDQVFDGIVSAAAFRPASNDIVFADRFEP